LDFPLVPGRSCGSCNVCCVALTINDPELQKVQGYRCRNLQPDHHCAIYATRPKTCREFYCGWMQLKWVRQTLRPDQSDVLIRLHGEISKTTGKPSLGIAITLLSHAALKADGLAETVAAAVSADVPVYLHIPGKPGYTSAQARLNEAVHHAVLSRDKPALLQKLRELRASAMGGPSEPIVLRPPESGGQSAAGPI
jgi:hypothetical protein